MMNEAKLDFSMNISGAPPADEFIKGLLEVTHGLM